MLHKIKNICEPARFVIEKINKKTISLFISIFLVLVVIIASDIDLILEKINDFSVTTLSLISIILLFNMSVVTLRVKYLISVFGISVPYKIVSKASLQGHLAALFVISFVGQIAGRHWVLRNHGVPAVFIATLTAVERAVLLVTSGGMCAIGAAWLLDSSEISRFFGNTSLTQILCVALISLIACLWIGRSNFEMRILGVLGSGSGLRKILAVTAITLAAQLLVLGAFVTAGKALVPSASFWDLLAAAAITSFAASLPISINGWGVRETAAVFAFGQIGVPSSAALAISIMIGVCSTLVILVMLPFSRDKKSARPTESDSSISKDSLAESGAQLQKIATWILALGSAILIFFQIHAPLPTGIINLNIADALSIIALAAVASHCISTHTQPAWTIPAFNTKLTVISLSIVAAFLHGAQVMGITHWAFAGRLMGWLVLLGYLSIGVLVVAFLGQRGSRRFIEAMAVAAAAVIIAHAAIRGIGALGWLDIRQIPQKFEAYAGNRNAFAFQALYQGPLIETHVGDSPFAKNVIHHGKHREVFHGGPTTASGRF